MNNTYKILWAEDDGTLRDVMCELMQSEGYQCRPVEHGLKAKELLQKERFDLLISDFKMPELDGAHLLFWCRQNNFHLPVIFITAAVDRGPLEELVLKDCCSSILNKPCGLEEVLQEIEKAKRRNHEFECRGKTVPLSLGDYQQNFPGEHYF